MITQSLDIIKQKVGIYVMMLPAGILFIESDEQGNIHQLKAETLERDGIISKEGWNHATKWQAIGPLQRAPA